MSSVLVATGAAIFAFLGIAHAVFALQSSPSGGPMMPTNPDVRAAMQTPGGLGLAPHLQTSLFRSWIGFNLSHSLCVIITSGVLLWHGVNDLGAATNSPWFLALAFIVPATYLLLAASYWFDQPRNAIALGALLVWIGVAVELI